MKPKNIFTIAMIMFLIVLLLGVVYSHSEIARDYYWNGSIYLVDGINSSDVGLNGYIPVNGDDIELSGWSRLTGGTRTFNYDNGDSPQIGNLSIKGSQNNIGIPFNNNTFNGSIGFKVLHHNDGGGWETFSNIQTASCTGNALLTRDETAGTWAYSSCDGATKSACDLNTIVHALDTWYNVTFVWNDNNGVYADGFYTSYVNGTACHSESVNETPNFIYPSREGQSQLDYIRFDDFYVSNSNVRPSGAVSVPLVKSINITSPLDNAYTESSSQLVLFNISNMQPNICELFANDTGVFAIKDSILSNGTFNVTETVNATVEYLDLNNVLGFYRGEENGGTNLTDTSGLDNHGTLFGSPIYTASSGERGTGNYTVDYDGTNDYADIGAYDGFKTVSLWVNSDIRSGYDYYFGHNNFRLYAHTTTGMVILGDSAVGSITSTFDVDTHIGAWFHVVAISDGANSELFINNVSEGTDTLESIVSATTNIGRWTGGTHYTNGRIDEIIIFNKTLNLSEISDLYQNGLVKFNITTVENTTIFNTTINASLIQNLSWNFLPNTLKVADYFVQCNDGENVSSQTNTITYKTDLTPPTITVLTPSVNESFNDTVHINWTTSEPTTCILNLDNFTIVTSNTTFYSYQEILIDNGDFTGNISCSDLAFNNATEQISFTKDTILPAITWTFPNSADTSQAVINTSQLLIVEATDVNLFAYECLIYDVNSIQRFNFSQENLITSTFSVQENFIPDKLGNWTVQCTFSDSHTAKEFRKPKEIKNLNENKINFEILKEDRKGNKIKRLKKNVSIEYTGAYILRDITTTHDFDRTKFNFKYKLTGYKAPTIKHSYRLTCDDIYYIPEEQSGFKAHFVCKSSNTWVDFENDDIISYEVWQESDNVWIIETVSYTNENVQFNSIGGLNFNTESHNLEVVQQITDIEFLDQFSCPSETVPEVLLFGLLFIILLSMYLILKFYVRFPILTILVTFIGFTIYGLSLFACSSYIGGLFILLGIILSITELF